MRLSFEPVSNWVWAWGPIKVWVQIHRFEDPNTQCQRCIFHIYIKEMVVI